MLVMKQAFPNPMHFLSFDVLLPWAGVIGGHWFAWSEGLSEDNKQLMFVFVIPMALCIARAGVGTPQMKQPWFKSRPRSEAVAHQVLFALAILVLMLFEFGAAVLSYAEGAPLEFWVIAFGVYGLYTLLIYLSNRAVSAP